MGRINRLWKVRALLACSYIAATLPSLALAQDWPSRRVTVVVPFGPGSTPDTVARLLADRLQARFGQPFVVENKPGGSGNIGTAAIARAALDGHTIGVSIGGPLAINTLLFPSMPYDPLKDLAPVALLVAQPSILVVSNSVGARSVGDLIALLRQSPGQYNYASIGNGSLSHLAMEAIAMQSGTRLVHVPYASSPEAMTALIRGDVQMAVLPAASVVPQGNAGHVRMLAVTSASRSPLLPELPTIGESGVLEVQADAWNALVAPARTDPHIVFALHSAVQEVLRQPEARATLKAQYMEPLFGTPEDLTARMQAEVARWRPVIEAAHIRVGP
jgi:tripartite-type tricarboxylate transporter receptor subunit TctC